MIIEIGTDFANMARTQWALERFGDRFRDRVFMVTEPTHARRTHESPAATYAKRWKAKEA